MTTKREDIEEPDETATSGVFGWLTIGSLLILLWLPLLATLFTDHGSVSATEKRYLAALPALDARPDSWLSFPRELEQWYDDHVGFRDTLIRGYALLKIELFGVSPTDTLVVGKDGWFFFGDPDD